MWIELLRPYLRFAKLRFKAPPTPFSCGAEIITILRDLHYVEQWRLSREKGWYHLYLEDHSFFSFEISDTPSYTFFDRPIDVVPLSEYALDQGLPLRRSSYEVLKEEYESLMQTAPIRENITPVRYDFDPASYRRGVHPAGHVHIGLDNEIRIAVRRKLNPIAFVLFVIRQLYPSHWEHLMDSPMRGTLDRRIRTQLEEIVAPLICNDDDCEMYLH